MSRSRSAVCWKRKSSTRTIPRFALFAFLLPCLAQGPASTNATVYSEQLRGFEDNSLLFWSTFEFSIDAALQFLGPVDDFLRGSDAPARSCLDPHDISSSACREQTPFFNEFIGSVDELFGNVIEGLSLVFSPKEAVAVVSDSETKLQAPKNKSTTVAIPRGGAKAQKFSLFQKGDGSERDPDGIPMRYMIMQNGNRDKAKEALEATLAWRKEHDIDNILIKPHPKFDIAKEVFPHFFLGRDKNGDILFLQRPALIDIPKAKKNGLTKENLLMHYVYVNEYLWQILEGHKPVGTMTSIIDLTGLQLGVLRKREMIQFLKLFVQTMDTHYPQRAHKTLLLNAPKWFNTMYKLLSPLIRESTKAKIEIHSKGRKQDEALRKYLSQEARDSLPASFWSKSLRKGAKKEDEEKDSDLRPEVVSFNTKMDEELRAYAVARLKDAGKKMLPVL